MKSAWFGRVGASDALPDKMPSIWLIKDPACPDERARMVADGCEEEGIPLAWDERNGSARELAKIASLRSRLEIGIGLGADGTGAIALVSVTERPYIEGEAVSEERLRWMGQAAARMSKSLPVPDEIGSKDRVSEKTTSEALRGGDGDDAAALVKRAVMSLQNTR
jgi:hypothetical protein